MSRRNATYCALALVSTTLLLSINGCASPLTKEDRKAMWSAVSSNDFEAVKRLVEEDPRRAHMFTSDDSEYTALHHCVVYNKNDMRIAEYLLLQGVDPNKQATSGFTPLHTAVWDSNLEYVQLLLKYGADVNRQEFKKGESPLEMARRYGGGTQHLVAEMERHLQSQSTAGL